MRRWLWPNATRGLRVAIGFAPAAASLLLGSCTTGSSAVVMTDVPDATVRTPDASVAEAAVHDAAPIVILPDAMPPGAFCALPGSVVWTAKGPATMPGGDAASPDLTWLHLPVGFCAHAFANVPEVRQLRVAPGGDVFAASPSTPTAGGATGGWGKVVVLPDDDHDGVADSANTFVDNVASVQGLAFAGGLFFYQNGTTIESVPFRPGDRQPSAAPQAVTTITAPQASEHWPKVIDVAQDGSIYVTNGGSEGDACISTRPVLGAVFKVTGAGPDAGNTIVARGFRNPIALRCETNHNVCLVAELERDGSSGTGGREKIVPLRAGDD
ncbi:MAG: DUF7133 domain-containing protein, partial [Polyangiaceae bacterium]